MYICAMKTTNLNLSVVISLFNEEESLAELLFAGAVSERDAFLLTRNPETLQRRLYGDVEE